MTVKWVDRDKKAIFQWAAEHSEQMDSKKWVFHAGPTDGQTGARKLYWYHHNTVMYTYTHGQ